MTNPDSAGGLLPCPFCGSAAERIDFGVGSGDNEGGSCIACTKCQASGPVEFGYKENFVSNWNRRAELCRAAPAGGECQHEWQPDADVMNARYCPKCDVTQTIPRKSVKPPAPIGLLYEQIRAEIDGGSESMTHEDALQWVRDVRDSAPAGSGEVEVDAWKVGMFDRWNDYAKQLGYTGMCDALSAIPLLRKLQQGAE